MQLSKESIEEFKRIFKKEYGRELTYEEAYEAAFNLLGFFELLWKIDRRLKREQKKKDKK